MIDILLEDNNDKNINNNNEENANKQILSKVNNL